MMPISRSALMPGCCLDEDIAAKLLARKGAFIITDERDERACPLKSVLSECKTRMAISHQIKGRNRKMAGQQKAWNMKPELLARDGATALKTPARSVETPQAAPETAFPAAKLLRLRPGPRS